MATYRIAAPDGNTYQIDGPENASQAQIEAEVLKQHPVLSKPKAEPKGALRRVLEANPLTVLADVGVNSATGLAGTIAGGYAGALSGASQLLKGKGLDAATTAATNEVRGAQNALTVPPQTEIGAGITNAMGRVMEGVGDAAGLYGRTTIPWAPDYGEAAGRFIAEAGPAVAGGVSLARGIRTAGAPAREAAADKSRLNQPTREVLQIAKNRDIVVNPAHSNPTFGNRALVSVGGEDALNQAAATQNILKINAIAREDLGVAAALTPSTFENGIYTPRSKSYGEVEKVKALPATADPKYAADLAALNSAEGISPAYASILKTPAVQDLINSLNQPGMTGTEAVRLMRQLRNKANRVFDQEARGAVPDDATYALAQAQKLAAKAIEDMTVRSLREQGKGALADRWIEDRRMIAKGHTLERLTDTAGNVDAVALGERLKKGKVLDGGMEEIARIGAMFPESVSLTRARSGLPTSGGGAGTTGWALGGAPGAIAARAGWPVVGKLARDKALSPSYQAKYAQLPDYRPMREQMGYPPTNALAPEAPTNGLALAPGWEPSPWPQRPQAPTLAGNQFTLGERAPAQPSLYTGQAASPTPSAVRRMGMASEFSATEPTALNMPSVDYPGYPPRPAPDLVTRTQTQLEAAQAAREAATRRPAGTGQALNLDPVTGRLVPADQGLRGATPDTIVSTGHSLASAAAKLSGRPLTPEPSSTHRRVQVGTDAKGAPVYEVVSTDTTYAPRDSGRAYPEGTPKAGQPVLIVPEPRGASSRAFALSAEERIAWDRTKVDLESVTPGLSKLSDKAVANKMMDRQWVQAAIDKARQQAAGFDEIARRATDAAKIRAAVIQREKLLDASEALNDMNFRSAAELDAMGDKMGPRGSNKLGWPGPKTRAAQRNNLRPD